MTSLKSRYQRKLEPHPDWSPLGEGRKVHTCRKEVREGGRKERQERGRKKGRKEEERKEGGREGRKQK